MESHSPLRLARILWLAIFAITLIGCDIPSRPPLLPAKESRSKNGGGSIQSLSDGRDQEDGPGVGPFKGDWETWDAYYIRGNHVGYSHAKATLTADDVSLDEVGRAEKSITYQVEDQLKVRRGKSVVVQQLTQTSRESTSGKLIDFEAELRIGPVNNQFFGRVAKENLVVETIRGSSRSTRKIAWKPDTHGLLAVQQSLRRRPMQRGEVRRFQMLMPGQYQLADMVLSCSGTAAVPMLDGEHQVLTEINQQIKIGDETTSESIIWTDSDGNTLKTYTPALQLAAYRTDEETAMKNAIKPDELVTATGIDVSGNLDRPLEAKRVAFQVKPSSLVRDPKNAVVISASPDQYTRAMPDGSYQILISRVIENVQKGFVESKLELVDDDLKPNALVDFKAPLINKMTDAAVSAVDMTDMDIALDLTRTVRQLISFNSLSHGLKRASKVAQDGEGDSTGQAILLAAFLRAKGIPARVAAGLVYRPAEKPGDNPRMVYHMWTLAYIDGRWLSLDATLGQAAPPDRITLVTSNLSGGDEYKSLAPILSVIGQIEIKVVGAEY